MKHILICSGLVIFALISCNRNKNCFSINLNDRHIKVALETKTDTSFILTLNVNNQPASSWKLNYPVYRFDFGDITGDGVPEIAVGVIKPTRFDKKKAKRLFLFKITDDNYIRPLWLGSRLGQPLDDFRIIQTDTGSFIRTIEQEQSGNYLLAEYRLHGFGLEFVRYLEREIPLNTANKHL